MKKLSILVALLITSFAKGAFAKDPTYTNLLVNVPGLAYNNQYSLDLSGIVQSGSTGNAILIDQISMQATASSQTFPAQSFTDGTASTSSITISTTNVANLVPTQAQDIITVASNSLGAAAGSVVVTISSNPALSGSTLTIAGLPLLEGSAWTKGNTSSNTAASLLSAVNGRVPNVSASLFVTNGTSFTITCTQTGTFCNAYTALSSTQAAMGVSGATFSGGLDNTVINLNGITLTNGVQWNVQDTSSNTAIAIKNAVNSYASAQFTASTNTTTSVLIKANNTGTRYNSSTLSVNNTGLTLTGATFAGGLDTPFITINGVTLTEGVDWTTQSTASGTARAISNAIQANATLQPLISSTWTKVAVTNFGVVSATAAAAGVNAYGIYAFPPAYFTIPAPAFQGGTASAINTSNSYIQTTSGVFTLALPVLYANVSGTSPGTLVTGTTYYAVPVSGTTGAFKLASSASNALAGTAVAITTQTTTGGGSFTLTALPITGTASYKWQASNDQTGTNWVDINVSSVTLATPYTATSSLWDFGTPGYRYIRLNFVAPTTGGINLVVNGYGKGRN